MPLRHAVVLAAAFGLAVAAGAAQADPWDVGTTDFGATAARGSTTGTDGPFTITGIGLFCGSTYLNPGKINLYIYGLPEENRERPASAAFILDGHKTAFQMMPILSDYAVHIAVVPRDFVRALTRAKQLQVVALPGRLPDAVDMTGADAALRKALRPCFK